MSNESLPPIRIATRASRLALWQAEHVRELLKSAAPERAVEIVPLSTIGDRDKIEPLTQLGGGSGVGIFTREIQAALLDGRADVAVHSLKDLPTDPVVGLTLAAVPVRGAMFDALVLPAEIGTGIKRDLPRAAEYGTNPTELVSVETGFCTTTSETSVVQKPENHRDKLGGVCVNVSGVRYDSGRLSALDCLPNGARVGSGSPRRRAQLLHLRPDLQFVEARGNVETRLRKLDEGQFEALVLAEAGLTRLELAGRISAPLQPPLMLPAVGQGALGIECRSDDESTREVLARLTDFATLYAVLAERIVLATLRAGCHAPLGVWTRAESESLRLTAVVLSLDGVQRFESDRIMSVATEHAAIGLGRAVAEDLLTQGAAALLSTSAGS